MLYLLLPVTILVWGFIVYRILNNMHTETGASSFVSNVTIAANESLSDTFSIEPSYRDPFLGRSIQRDEYSTNEPAKAKAPAPAPVFKIPTPWPVIVYGGIIKNQKLKREMVLLQIDGQDYMLQSGETVKGIQLLKVFGDSIEVNLLKEKKIIHK